MHFSKIEAITFDCYGTLIDWETGIVDGIRKAFPGLERPTDEILRLYSEIEPQLQESPYRCYRAVLTDVVLELGRRFQTEPPHPDVLANSLPNWEPFPDTVPALKRLRHRFRLGVISNIDDALFAATAKHLEVDFDVVVTAEQVHSYKPCRRNFEAALARFALPPDRILHVAESLFHDVAPARELGFRTIWVSRRGVGQIGASRKVEAKPDQTVRNLRELADLC